MEPSAVADELDEVSVLVNVAHRLLLSVRDELEASSELHVALDDLNAAHDQLDLALEHLGRALDRVDGEAERPRPREPRPTIH